jgi:hypothetical protein
MNKHARSSWRHPLIVPVKMSDLTVENAHLDERYVWKTLPTMRERGLDYPLICWIIDEDFYKKRFMRFTSDDMLARLPDPVFHPPGKAIMIKGGNNRFLSASDIGYDMIDCLIFDDQIDAIKWTRYLDHCDPLRNPDKPYLGLIEYK